MMSPFCLADGLPSSAALPYVASSDTEFKLVSDIYYNYSTHAGFSTGSAFSTINSNHLTFTSSGDIPFSLKFVGPGLGNKGLRAISSGTASILGGAIEFINLKDILFKGNTVSSAADGIGRTGGAISNMIFHTGSESALSMGISFTDIHGVVSFENNSSVHGGAIYSKALEQFTASSASGKASIANGLSFRNISGGLSFTGNEASYYGGAINLVDQTFTYNSSLGNTSSSIESGLYFENIKGSGILFADNKANNGGGIQLEARSTAKEGTSTTNSGIVFRNIRGDISFSHNIGNWGGGAIAITSYSYASSTNTFAITNSGIVFDIVAGDIIFTENNGGRGGAIELFTTGYGIGDSVTSNTLKFQNIMGNISFTNNNTQGKGGVLYSGAESYVASIFSGLQIRDVQGFVLFSGNHADEAGGAIALETEMGDYYSNSSMDNSIFLSADGGDITFIGNTMGTGNNIIANSIYLSAFLYGGISIDGSLLPNLNELRAQQGYSIYFYDPIVAEDNPDVTSDSPDILYLNRTDSATGQEYKGEILFSGEKVTDYIIQGSESDEDYKARLSSSKHSMIRQNVELRNGSLHVAHDAILQMKQLTVSGAEAKTTKGGLIKADSIYLYGALFNMQAIYDNHSPLALDTPLLLGNNLTVYNKNGSLYSHGGFLNENRTFAILTLKEGASDFSGFTLDDYVDDRTGSLAYGNQGKWEFVWDIPGESTSNDVSHTLYAIWTYTGYLEEENPDPGPGTNPPVPEPAELHDPESVYNSLWSSQSNLLVLSRSAIGQIAPNRYTMAHDSNYWVMGLGDFNMMRSSSSNQSGYDYWGSGYALGADTRIGKNAVIGIGFGQLYGTSQSRSKFSSNDQKSIMGIVYAGYRKNILNKSQSIRYEASIGYGSTDNKLYSYDKLGQYAYGSWNNTTYMATFQINWDHYLGASWIVTPFLGMEYSTSQLDSFTESGRMSRHFGKTDIHNIALPVGMEIFHIFDLANGQFWSNSLAISYVPDLYRENPGSQVINMDTNAILYGSTTTPTRNAARVRVASRYQLNNNWAVFAGYQLEARNHSFYHNANIGINISF